MIKPDILEKACDNLDELRDSLNDILNNKDESKGRKLILIEEELKKLQDLSRETRDVVTTDSTSDRVGGRYHLRVVTSRGNECYFLENFDREFFVETQLKPDPSDPENTITVYNGYCTTASKYTLDHATLTEAIVASLVLVIEHDETAIERLDKMENCSIVRLVKARLK